VVKSKHFDTIIMDDIVQVTAKDPKVKAHAEALQKYLNYGLRKSAILPRGHFKTTGGVMSVIQTIWEQERDRDYELARELIEEVCQD
jgi:hypothetical protein